VSRNKSRFERVDGILLYNKETGPTSNAALQQVRRLFNARKAGHTGSLDPLATGLLPICFGEATKLSQYLTDSDKQYIAEITLGISTDSGDSKGNVLQERPVDLTEEQVLVALESFSGQIEQVPPMYSALKKDGQPLYKLARQGIEVERKPRTMQVFSLELISFDGIVLSVAIHCSKGFYVRSLAIDLGEMLGCGAHVSALQRTAVGDLSVNDAYSMSQLDNLDPQGRRDVLLSPDMGVPQFPAVNLPIDAAHYLRQGQAVIADDLPEQGLVRVYGSEGEFLGLGDILPDRRVAPKRMFNFE
jgi:tRNA pseudouridine55 synthase